MSRNKLLEKVTSNPNPKVKLAVVDIDGVLRGKYIHKDKFTSALDHGVGFCNVIFGWDSHDALYEQVDHTGWHTGYPDDTAFVAAETFREVPWDNHVPFFLADFSQQQEYSHPACSRSLLKKITANAEQLGFNAMFSQEFEWFNFRENSESLAHSGYVNPSHLTTGMFGYSLLRMSQNKAYFNDLYDLLAQFDIPLEGLHTETGPGVVEAAILYSDIVTAADRAVLLKTSVKEIALSHGIMPSFMAKVNESLPGCSGHIHQSLWKNNINVFHDATEKYQMSELMQHYLAGQLHCLPEILPMFAPTINSYKRLVEGMWAPTTVNWGIDNRTTAFRVINASQDAMRIESRVPGSDTNPYLAMAAALASGLYGIENKLALTQPLITANGYADQQGKKLSATLWDATQKMQQSELAKTLFGDAFVTHFCATREWEWREHLKAVTNWEVKRYFEII